MLPLPHKYSRTRKNLRRPTLGCLPRDIIWLWGARSLAGWRERGRKEGEREKQNRNRTSCNMEAALKAMKRRAEPPPAAPAAHDTSPPKSPRPPGMSEEKWAYWSRMATPRAGSQRHDVALKPPQQTEAAIWQRNQFLAEHGYLRKEHPMKRAAALRPPFEHSKPAELTVAQQQARLHFCFRTGTKVPERYIQSAKPTETWVNPLQAENAISLSMALRKF